MTLGLLSRILAVATRTRRKIMTDDDTAKLGAAYGLASITLQNCLISALVEREVLTRPDAAKICTAAIQRIEQSAQSAKIPDVQQLSVGMLNALVLAWQRPESSTYN
jgi:hypothetical protein